MISIRSTEKVYMVPLLATATAIIFLTTLWVPVLLRSYSRNQARLEEQLYLVKLRLVRRFYPQLQDLTYLEIAKQYDVEELYDNIGRKPYHLS